MNDLQASSYLVAGNQKLRMAFPYCGFGDEENQMHEREEKIRARAYELWLADGGQEGNAENYWYRAERELSERTDVDISDDASKVKRPPTPAGFAGH